MIAVATLRDTRDDPVLPRWTGYAQLWAALGIVPASFVVFFHSGPLAWNGVLAWWVVLVDFFAWMCLVAYSMLHAIAQQQREEASLEPDYDVAQLAADVAALQAEVRAGRSREQGGMR